MTRFLLASLAAGAAAALALSGCNVGHLSCDAPKVTCGDACIDVTADSSNCGGCGHACAAKEICEASTCKPGPKTTIYAACFNTGELVTLDGESLAPIGARAVVGGGPQSLGFEAGRLLIADGIDNALYSFDPAATPPTKLDGGDMLGKAVNQLLLDGTRGFAINTTANTIQALDLAKALPGALDNSRTIDEVALPANSSPTFGAFIGQKLYVTLYGSCMSDEGETAGNRVQEIDFSQGGAGQLGRQIVFDAPMFPEGKIGSPRPAGIAALGTDLYVAIGNRAAGCMGDGPGPSYLARIRTADSTLPVEIIPLPDRNPNDAAAPFCRNAGTVLTTKDRIYVACLGGYGYTDGGEALVVLDAATRAPLHTTKLFRCGPNDPTTGPSGCRTAVPGRLAIEGERLLIADMNAGRLLVTDLEGNIPSGMEKGVALCDPKCFDEQSCYQMTSDVLPVTR